MTKETALKVILKQFSQTNDIDQAISDILFIFDEKAAKNYLKLGMEDKE